MKDDIDDEETNLSEDHYDYNVGRDAHTFLVFLRDSDFYKQFFKTQLGQPAFDIISTIKKRNDDEMEKIEEQIRRDNQSRKRAKNRKARRRARIRQQNLNKA